MLNVAAGSNWLLPVFTSVKIFRLRPLRSCLVLHSDSDRKWAIKDVEEREGARTPGMLGTESPK